MMKTAKHLLCLSAVLMLLPAMGTCPVQAVVSFSHPCMLHRQADIDYVRAHLSAEPLRSAYAHLQGSAYAQTSRTDHTAQLLDGYLKRMDYNNWGPSGVLAQYADYSNYTALMYDAAACYQLALRYRLSGDGRYAQTAVKILNAWAAKCKGILRMDGYVDRIPDPNLYLINIQAYQLANAAELLRDYEGWQTVDFQKFQQWMYDTFYEVAHLFLTNHGGHQGDMHFWFNWDLASLTAVLSIGILCDSQTLVSEAVDYYKGTTASRQEAGYVRNAVPFLHQDPDSDELLGQCQESGRDQGHATLCVSLLGAFCQMAFNVGEDLFAYDDYRALRMAEYVAKYNLPTAATCYSSSRQFVYSSMPYTAYSNPSYNCPTLSADGRGTLRPCWELFYAYASRHGQPMRYCGRWVELMRSQSGYGSDGGGGDYGTTSGGFDQLGYGTLMFGVADDDPATESELPPVADTQLRKETGTASYGSKAYMEIYTVDREADADRNVKARHDDLVGLLAFSLPQSVQSADVDIVSATLRLVTKRLKGDDVVHLYAFGDFTESSTYDELADAVTAARSVPPVAVFHAAGQWNKDVEVDKVDQVSYSDILSWTNNVDITSHVTVLPGLSVNLMVAAAANGDQQKMFFTREAEGFVNTKNEAAPITATSVQLRPQLIVSYQPHNTNKVETIVLTALPDTDSPVYTLAGQRVDRPAKGLYVVGGRKVIVR